jgi:predicted Zn-dependent protease
MQSVLYILFITLAFQTWSCVTNSEGRRAYTIVPDSQMTSMGVQAYSEIIEDSRKKGTLVPRSSAAHEVVERIGKRIAGASGVDFKWEFVVINEPKTVNAFCLPGGKIAVYTGIFPVAKDESSLAAIMGHEVAHATLRHGAERMSQQLTLAGLSTAVNLSMSDSRHRDIALGVFGMGAQFGIILPFSRGHETEADSVGLRFAAKAGFNPYSAVGLWERMGASGKSPFEFMSTHPDPANRQKALAAKQSEVMPLYNQSEKQVDKDLPKGV